MLQELYAGYQTCKKNCAKLTEKPLKYGLTFRNLCLEADAVHQTLHKNLPQII